MNTFIKTLAFILIYAISASPLWARLFRVPEPDELASESTLICNGLVESITKGSTDKGTGGSWDLIIHFTAKIKILHVFKGEAPSEIELNYHLEPYGLDGPIQIQLTTGERFRFFLKNSPITSSYVGVLNGQYDDGFAVEPLAPQEPDDSAYVSKAEAMEIARKWLKDNYPDLPPLVENPRLRPVDSKPDLPPINLTYNLPPPAPRPVLMIGSCFPGNGKWTLVVMEKSATGAITGNKRIIILSDRSVDKQSWTKWP